MPLQCSSCNTTGMVLTVISRLHGGKQRKEVKNVWSPKNVAQAQGQDPYIGPVVDRLSRAWKKPPDKKPGTRLHRGGKGKKWSQIGKISVTKVSLGWGGKSSGAWRHAFGATVPWYQILVSYSDWSNVFTLTDSWCCWQYRALLISRSYN